MLPITLANLQQFCRICLHELTHFNPYKPNHEVDKENISELLEHISHIPMDRIRLYKYPDRVCHSCYIKMIALDSFREKCIIGNGVLKMALLENLKEAAMSKLKTFCRICLKPANDQYDVDEPLDPFRSDYNLGYSHINNIKDDNRLPRSLCGKCFSKHKTLVAFRLLAQQSDEYIGSLIIDPDVAKVKNEGPEFPTVEFMVPLDPKNFSNNILAKNSHEIFPAFEKNSDLLEWGNQPIIKTEYIDTEIQSNEPICNDEASMPSFEVLKVAKSPLNDIILKEENVFDYNTSKTIPECSPTYDADENPFSIESTKDDSDAYPIPVQTSKDDSDENSILVELAYENPLPIESTKDDECNDPSSTKKTESKPTIIKKKISRKQRKLKNKQCNKCDKAFYKQIMLDAHIKSVHEGIERPFSCESCPSTFRQHCALERHKLLLHKPKEPMPTDVDVFAPPKANIHVCMTCLRQFKRKDVLEQHINTAHTDIDLRPFKCKLCQKGFGSKRTMMRHEKNHSNERPFACKFCPKRYNTKVDLTTHMQRHTTNPDLLCPICKRGKSNQEELQKHIEMHRISRQHQCPTCGRVFTKLFHLREHENSVHLKLRPFKCTHCDKTFATRRTQKEHEQLHDPTTRPVFCILCTMNFKNETQLSRHMTKDHNQIPKKMRRKNNQNAEEQLPTILN